MSYDEQPDGDPHGECAAEIHRLERDLAAALEENAKLRAFVSQPHLRYEYEAFCADFPKEKA